MSILHYQTAGAPRNSPIRNIVRSAVVMLLVTTAAAFAGDTTKPDADAPLPTGRRLDTAGALASQGIGSMPLNLALSPDGKFIVTTGNGYIEQLCSVRAGDGKAVSTINFDKNDNPHNGLYYGLAFASDGRLYAAQGAAQSITVFKISPDGVLTHDGDITCGSTDFPAGIAADAHGRIYVTQNETTNTPDIPFGTPGSVSIIDAASGKELGRYVFPDPLGLSNFPLAVAVNDDGSRLYVGSQRDDAVYVLDASNPADVKLVTKLSTGSHPNALLLNKARTRLFVANTQSDTISIVDTAAQTVAGTVLLRPDIASRLAGATPTGLALSPDEDTLYSSLGDMNAVAVIDVDDATPRLKGYIPAGWYPTAVTVVGNDLFVTNAKGDLTRVPHDFSTGTRVTSPLYLLQGTLWKTAIPDDDQLAKLTDKCLEDARLTPKYLNGENPLQSISLKSGNITHVIYIVKENRTYDQVLGDLPQGNGDPNRCLFGRDVTPNLHALAERFVLFDNFYDSGEVSGDGWTWSTQAQANEDTIRNIPYEYSGRGRTYDTEGMNNKYPTGGLPATGPDGAPLSDDPRFKNGAPPVPDIDAPAGGHLWDMARKIGLTYRNYGFFLTTGVYDGDKTVIPDNYPSVAGLQPPGHDLAGITDIDFREFDLSYPDSQATSRLAEEKKNHSILWTTRTYGKDNADCRFTEWKREFDLMLAKDPNGNAVPALMTVRFGNDHTGGAGSNAPTPRAMVADNDFAVGQLVDAVSKSPIWKSTAIIVVEDDAQNGPDHVDIHRSTCFVISPWIKANSVDHSFQSTISTIKTIECLLNMPPMCQYDAASDCLGGWDTSPSNAQVYTAVMPPEKILLERGGSYNRNIPASPESPTQRGAATRPTAEAPLKLDSLAALAEASDQMDFKKADQAPADELNRIIWKTVKGVDSEPPPTPHVISYGAIPEKDPD
ncbi:MAG: beta-propeller fold lactonase family protein [Tepidisphaeraceae bacterium]